MAGTVTVVIPTYRNPGTLARAVESVLAQDYTDLLCLVINDGADPADTWAPLAHLNDPRLVRFDLTENRGRFYAEALALAVCDTPWFHPHDSDDYSNPDRIGNLVKAAEATGAEYVVAGMTFHETGKDPYPWMPPVVRGRRNPPAGRRVYLHANYGTLWATDALRAIGGPHPDFRFGYDTMLGQLAIHRLRWTIAWDHGYHYMRRTDSLSASPETGVHTKPRRAAWQARERLWAAIHKAPTPDLAGHPSMQPHPDTAHSLTRDMARLREVLAPEAVA